MKVSYNWLKWYVPDAPSPEKLADIFTYHLCEVESIEKLGDGDTIFDLNILPNRAHDLLSHSGVARELSEQLGIPFIDPTSKYKIPESKSTNLKIKIESENCRRYMGRVIRNVKVGPSPEWVVKHLESIGQRSINNIVDATNLVMFDCGNPCHAFDLRKISNKEIKIQNATEGEELELVGREKVTAKLKATDLVIANSSGETLALAGVKGGTNSGIADDTTDILLEVANFAPVSVRKTSRRLGLLTDASKRFENDLSPELCDFAMMELSALLCEFFPEAEFEEIIDIYPVKQEIKTITFSLDYINKVLGTDIKKEEVEKILENYSFKNATPEMLSERSSDLPALQGQTVPESISGSALFTIIVPPLRLDLTGPHDMAEEIGRIYGYEKVESSIPKINLPDGQAGFSPKVNETYEKIKEAREKLVNAGYREVMTYTFAKKGDIEVARGLKGKDALRNNIFTGLTESYELNKINSPILGQKEIRIFEIGTVFTNNGEEIHIAVADKTGVEEMKLEDFTNANVEFHPADVIEQPAIYNLKSTTFQMWSSYPFITRDIAMWVPKEVESLQIYKVIKENAGEYLIQGPTLFDTFSKNSRTSYAFRLVFQSKDKTLTDEEVNLVISKINQELNKIPGLELR